MSLLIQDTTSLPRLAELVDEHAEGGSVLALSHLIQTGFPLVNVTGTDWASPYAHLWMVPALYCDSRGAQRFLRHRDTGKWQELEQLMVDRIWASIERDDPDLIILHAPLANGFDMRADFETDPRYPERFARSPVIDTVGRYIVFGRPDPG